ncbi:MAG TPA: tetratricopeptide repeat-containing serine protease family protein [Burkholderiales bacterium]|nr:tetratricopeptide repeat-containing serine protease family protein [Burkholderiales bacterium]
MARRCGMALLLAASVVPAGHAAKTPEQIFQQASQSVVVIHATDNEGNLVNQGGGVVTARELVTTNCHVIEGAARLEVQMRQQTYTGTVAASNEERDLCQIRVPQLFAPRVTLNTGRVRVGQRVYAIGAPEGLELTLSEGLISSLRDFDGSQYIQTSAAISQGSSGGGLFDTEGRLIGITSFFVGEGPNLNFALPAAWIVELERGGRARAAVGEQEPAEARWLRRVSDARAKKDWPAVVNLSQQWVRVAPKSARAWQELGDAYAATNRPRRAIPAYQQAVRYNGNSFDAWHNLGWTYLALNQYDRAIEAIEEALRITPGHPRATYNLGAAYHGQGLRDKVREVHAQLRRLDPALAGQFAKRYVKP